MLLAIQAEIGKFYQDRTQQTNRIEKLHRWRM